MKRWVCLVLVLSFVLATPCEGHAVSTSADSAILMDSATGMVLYEHNADAQQGIASTTKIMTGLLTAELCNLDQVIEVPSAAVGVEGSSLYLQHGQTISVRELLYGLLLKSGNDSAAALAIHIGGSIEDFAVLMNQKAKSLGMTGTSFVNPHGLTAENHHSTARDMAVLTRAAMENHIFAQVVGTKYYDVAGITVKNHNKLLWEYEGADGVKTGYTQQSGRCLVSSATRNGRRLIVVTLRDRDDWVDHAALFDYGFEQYTLQEYYKAGEVIAACSVYNGLAPTVSVVVPEDVSLLLPREQVESAEVNIILPQYFWAPVVKGSVLGLLQIKREGRVLYQGVLRAGESVGPRQVMPFWKQWICNI